MVTQVLEARLRSSEVSLNISTKKFSYLCMIFYIKKIVFEYCLKVAGFSLKANAVKKQSLTTRDYSMRCDQTKEMRRVCNITGVLPKCRSRTDGLTVSVFPDVLKVSRN